MLIWVWQKGVTDRMWWHLDHLLVTYGSGVVRHNVRKVHFFLWSGDYVSLLVKVPSDMRSTLYIWRTVASAWSWSSLRAVNLCENRLSSSKKPSYSLVELSVRNVRLTLVLLLRFKLALLVRYAVCRSTQCDFSQVRFFSEGVLFACYCKGWDNRGWYQLVSND